MQDTSKIGIKPLDLIQRKPFVMESFPRICYLLDAFEVALFAATKFLNAQLGVSRHQKETQAIRVQHFELTVSCIALNKNFPTEPMNGSNSDLPALGTVAPDILQRSVDTLLDGFGSLVSEGEGDDRGGIRALRNQPSDPVGEGPGLPRPSARDDEDVLALIHDCSKLFRCQLLIEDGVDIAHWSVPLLGVTTV